VLWRIGGGRGQWLGGGTMASAEHEPIMGSGGRSPSGVQRQSPWSGGLCRPEAESILVMDVQRSRQIWPLSKNVLSNFVARNKVFNHCRVIDAIQKVFMNVQSHNRIQTLWKLHSSYKLVTHRMRAAYLVRKSLSAFSLVNEYFT